MRNSIFITPFLLITVMLIFLQHHLVASLSLTVIQQKVALFQFKQSMNIGTPRNCFYDSYSEFYKIPSYPKTMNWSMSSDHCTWEGVSCEHNTRDVIGLDLSCSGLEGAILPNNTLFQLSHLHFLNLSQNDFSRSSHFPQEFGSFAKGLTHLNLSFTRFSGTVPSGISHLYKLVSLDLSHNQGFVELENEVFKSILQNLTLLRVLNLRDVNISSVLPVNLSTSLRVLNLRYTHLHGVLPQEVFHLPNLELLALGGSYSYHEETSLQAELPKVKWGSSGTLQHLILRQIDIHGGIPDSIGFLDSLATLYLSYCNLSGPIPISIGNLGQLTHLGLNNNNFNGPIPRSIGKLGQLTYLSLGGNNFNGPIPKLLANLTNIRYLHLYANNFTGPLPSFIAHFKGLIRIDLGGNGLTGLLPPCLFNHPSLEELILSDNKFTGQLYEFDSSKSQLKYFDCRNNSLHGPIPQSFSQLVNLTYLEFSSNNFSGQLSPWLFNHPSLEVLYLRDNGFTGQLYEFDSSKSQLNYFDCRYNLLHGPIPQSFSQLVNLTYLDFSSNNFSGQLSPWLFNHPSLEELYLRDNGFTGQLYEFDSSKSQLKSFSCGNNLLHGPIPQSFSQLVNLTIIDFSSNNFNGVLDIEMFSGLEQLETLDLSYNNLSVRSTSMATLPPKLIDLRLSSCNMKEFPQFSRDTEISLDWVDLSNNEIQGEIPHWIGSVFLYLNISHNRLTGGLEQLPWNNIQYLDLQSNKLNGSLPTLICNSSFLEVLNLSNNTLSGVLPICRTNLTALSVFDLRMNYIQGNIPATLSNFRNLETINLNGNKLEGIIPSSFAEFDYLQVLDLGNNQIKDAFPQCLEALPNLQVLVLKSNKFHGIISKSSEVEYPFPSLRIIDLSYNDFSGPLPAIYFRNFKSMMNGEVNKIKRSYMERDYYSDSTNLVIKGNEILLNKILTVYTTIDVSKNNFEGKIPVDIGYLVSLRFLNLSHNHLTGQIPPSIGKLIVLESLDLSTNQLEGEIPQQLTGLYSLALLNLSCNQLRGHIPEGSQFDTFANDSYVGNLGLCGNPLSKKCGHNNVMQEEDEDEDNGYFFSGFTWEAVVIGYGCGVVPAFIIGYLMLLARKPKWFAGIIAKELGLKIRRMEIKWKY